MFMGNKDFKATMSGKDFTTIRAACQFHPPISEHYIASTDPLWHCRSFMKEFLKNCASIAVGCGALSLDENSAPCTARCNAVSYMPSKPDKYAIRFYALCTSGASVYCCSMWDNGRGNLTGITPANNFTSVFRQMRAPFSKCFTASSEVDPLLASALWVLQMAQQHQLLPDPSGSRIVFMDNFYTRHILANKVALLCHSRANITISR